MDKNSKVIHCPPIDDPKFEKVMRMVGILQLLMTQCPESKELIEKKGALLIKLTSKGSHFDFDGKTPEDKLALLEALHEPYPSTDSNQ